MAQASATQDNAPDSSLPVWDLSDLYPGMDSAALKDDLLKAEQLGEAFAGSYGGKVIKLSGDELANAVKEYEAISELLGKLGSYAQLIYAENMADAVHVAFYQNTSEAINRIALATLFFALELNRIDNDTLTQKLSASPDLRHYAPFIRDVRKLRPHQLSDDLERLLHEKEVTQSAWARLFDETLANVWVEWDGEQIMLEEALDKLSDSDGAIREKAAKGVSAALASENRVLAMVTNILAKDKQIEDKWRKFDKPISARNVANHVEDEVVEALLSSVQGSYGRLSHRYYALKAKWLGHKDGVMPYWDRNAPLPSVAEKTYSWDEAVKVVLQAYGEFSPEMRTLGEKFFDNAWIDVPTRPGKAPGAFAHPTVPSSHPYLLLNFQGKLRDVMTLAHELGHGVHQLLSAEQGALMADTPLTLAETASVFGEQLTFRSLLKAEKDDARRKSMLASKVEDMLNTVVRQVAFCEFERRVHDARRAEGEVPAEKIGDIWLDVQKESLGPAIRFDDDYRVYWSYIPHFIHSPFYVYAYAFGDCLVNALYAVYQDGQKGFEDKYFTMLRAGGTLHHTELLAPFGLNASDPKFWDKGLNIIEEFIVELEGMG